jgi:hypothetical protein
MGKFARDAHARLCESMEGKHLRVSLTLTHARAFFG